MVTRRALMSVLSGAATIAAVGANVVPARASEPRGRPLDWASLNLTGLTGEPVDPQTLTGRVVLLVNTASRCAFTPQYDGLEALWDELSGRGLVVLGVPSNDFGRQEPGSNAEIAKFCSATYDVSFPMLQKARVVGADAHPLYRWAREAGGRAAVPAWNFHKIVIGRDGRFLAAFPSYVSPQAGQVTTAIERALATPAF